ncbi:hypothetical protein, partial [Burkholderia gladioli]|uniref:hypothetical protein n=1 Tax=Burkholderia gladioli TaxID=28095 RepID=UPI0034DB2E89
MRELAEGWLAIQSKAVGTDMAAFPLRLPPIRAIRAQAGHGRRQGGAANSEHRADRAAIDPERGAAHIGR